jgi:hypothetical protein
MIRLIVPILALTGLLPISVRAIEVLAAVMPREYFIASAMLVSASFGIGWWFLLTWAIGRRKPLKEA